MTKVEIATIMGTMQATLTDFPFLRDEWKENADEEALLGVSLTGIMDCKMFNGKGNRRSLEHFLGYMREHAVDTNKKWAKILCINQAAAVTCTKPSGTVSQLVDSASGIHPRFSPYYIRTVRIDKKDPLYHFLKDEGVPVEDEIFHPDSTAVFAFPMKSPDGAVTRDDVKSAIEQLELWKTYQDHWCEHKPSCTVYVKEHEWMAVGAWVYEHFDSVSGVSFLPYDNGTYQQAPYQEIDKTKYETLCQQMPKRIDWAKLREYEKGDTTRGAQTYACSGDHCEMVDLVDEYELVAGPEDE